MIILFSVRLPSTNTEFVFSLANGPRRVGDSCKLVQTLTKLDTFRKSRKGLRICESSVRYVRLSGQLNRVPLLCRAVIRACKRARVKYERINRQSFSRFIDRHSRTRIQFRFAIMETYAVTSRNI